MKGKYVAIHLDTGEYLVGDTEEEIMIEFRRRFPAAIAYTLRIGSPRLIARCR